MESAALYALLERDIVPGFYERSADGLPRRWIAQMKSSISTLCPTFNMQRMVKQYAADFYVTADEKYQQLTANRAARARALAAWTSHVQAHWKEVRVESVDSLTQTDLPVGSHLHVRARLQLGALTPDQVAVELYVGRLDADGELTGAYTIPMQPAGDGRAASGPSKPPRCRAPVFDSFSIPFPLPFPTKPKKAVCQRIFWVFKLSCVCWVNPFGETRGKRRSYRSMIIRFLCVQSLFWRYR